VFISGKPVAEQWIKDNADAVVQQFYPGELGGLAIAEAVFGAFNPSGKYWVLPLFSFWCDAKRNVCRQAAGVVPSICWNSSCVLQLFEGCEVCGSWEGIA
jgi:hypothetical protein